MVNWKLRMIARSLAHVSLGALAIAAFPVHAQAQESVRSYNIQAGPLSQALAQFADESGLALVYPASLAEGRSSPGVSGNFVPAEALSRLLAGTGLSFRFTGERTVTIEAATADGERVLGAVRVQGAQDGHYGRAGQAAGVNGVNGSRDITATEGTGSFTSGALTIGSKAPQAIKDVPQSVSVLTAERLEQQNITDFTRALAQAPGVSLAQGTTSLETTFYSRGFQITSIQVDGGAPLSTRFAALDSGAGYFPQIDMSQYDHVEVLRGAAGLFNGYGDPSGTINLVRKKPLDHGQVLIDAQAGSWSNYRAVIDATAPLAFEGRLRGRLVVTWQNNKHFYALAKDQKTLLYGIAELDLNATTLVSAGVSHTRQDSIPWSDGLPRYQNGDDLGLPRSTSFVFPWNNWDFGTTEIFGSIEQKIGENWSAKLNITNNRQSSERKVGLVQAGSGISTSSNSGATMFGSYVDFASDQLSAELTLSGSFRLFGQRQEVTMGVSRANHDGGERRIYPGLIASSPDAPYQPYPGGPRYCFDYGAGTCPADTIGPATPPVDVFAFNPFDPIYNEPAVPLPTEYFREYGQVQSLAYINLHLTPFSRLHLDTGLRWSRYEHKQASDQLCTDLTGNCAGRQIGDAWRSTESFYRGEDLSWPPAISVSYDLTDNLTAYVGYTDIYQDQSSLLDGDLMAVGPITGENIELGLKWAARDGRVNITLGAYRIEKEGFAILEPNFLDRVKRNPDESFYFDADGNFYVILDDGTELRNGQPDPYRGCCYVQLQDRTQVSEGIDAEITGELTRGFQIAASYTFSRNKQEGVSFGVGEGLPFLTIQPKHLYKLWASYDFGAAGASSLLSGLTISGGVNGQSEGYYSGNVCARPGPPSGDGTSTCLPDGTVPFEFTVPPYAVVSSRIDYRLDDNWSAALNVENIFDKTYYQSVGSVTTGNWYGAPRSFTVSLRGKW